ncbi:DUF4436 domain-containing protein [Mycobacterium tilburgii]|uniref:DUF4436 domain-containing protein n=1 Tax=Mycobacterium tilburgii TaxID=44467 RepID=UPI0021B44A9E
MKRAKGPLVFDLALCVVLFTLPTLALSVTIPMVRGKRKFVPPFGTWYAAMLFAIVPLRGILLGSPPPGSWIDQAVVQWVLIGLVVAMSLYIIALGAVGRLISGGGRRGLSTGPTIGLESVGTGVTFRTHVR